MPSSHPTRARARGRVRALVPTRQCQALLADEETHCSSHANGRGRYCATHGHEYVQLTRTYKAASNSVNTLEPGIQETRACVDVLDSVADIDGAVALVNRFLDALGEEIDGRETHHKRFFQIVDKNHQEWLKRQRGQEAAAVRLLERLRKRREEVVAMEAAAKRDEECRRTMEAAHRAATAEAQLRAIEEARRRTIEDEARRGAIEDARLWGIVETEREAPQARNVLGERTNTTPSNQTNTGPSKSIRTKPPDLPPRPWPSAPPELPPKPWLSVVPPNTYQTPQYPPGGTYYNTRQSTGESQPPVRPVGTNKAPVRPVPPINSWQVDIERQAPPTAHAGWQAGTEPTTPRDEDSVDCECVRILFWVATFFVFCYLVVVRLVEYLQQGYRLIVG